MGTELKRVMGSVELPLAPPPFYLEREIRLSGIRTAFSGILLGFAIMALYLVVHGPLSHPLPSMWFLTLVSVLAVSACLAIRFSCYRLVWTWVSRTYPLYGSVHPAARGELPRNAYLLVLMAPTIILAATCTILILWKIRFGPEMWLVIAVAFAACWGDLLAARHVVRVDSDHWIMGTDTGLDVLRLVAQSKKD
jgi:hypothetical protein